MPPRQGEFSGTGGVEFLNHLRAQQKAAGICALPKQLLSPGLLRKISGAVHIEQDIGVEEKPIVAHKALRDDTRRDRPGNLVPPEQASVTARLHYADDPHRRAYDR